jgi:protein involved in polysaccharide export with SLBB domain
MNNLAKHKLILFATVGTLLWSGAFFVTSAQTPSLPGSLPDSSLTPVTRDSGSTGGRQTEADESGMELPARQLITMMRSNPELMVEVKSLVSEQASQQGITVQADSLTDEEVFAQVYSNRQLRQNLTAFLRARGYLNEEDFRTPEFRNPQSPVNFRNNQDMYQDGDLYVNGASGYPSSDYPDLYADERFEPDRRMNSSIQRPRTPVTNEPATTRPEPNITDDPTALHRSSPYNLLSLRDLYTQVPDTQEHLKRFGTNLFASRNTGWNSPFTSATTGIGSATPAALDVPLGPEYVLGPGDQLNINLWGGVSQNLIKTIDREGRVTVLESGPIQVAGLTMAKAEALIQDVLQAQYRNVRVTLTVSRLRSIRIFVVGDVQKPGSYEVSALAGPISVLFAAGGPSPNGSMRVLRHYRNQKLVGEIDLYEFMLHGVRANDDRLEAGDTLLVPPVGPQVAIYGAVKRQAIYELRSEKELAEVLEDAGGVTVAAALTHITIDRVVANQRREEIPVEANSDGDATALAACLKSTAIKDGDRVHVGAVLPYSERVVYLQGHVTRPGRIAFHEKLQISDVLHGYHDLLPEPAERGEIVRLVAPDLHPETIEFDVPAVLTGSSAITLQPFDTIRIFGRYEVDGPTVSVRGEVERPGTYPLFDGMTASQLVRTAGGFKRDALVQRADLASYQIVEGTRISTQRRDIAIGDAVLKEDRGADAQLKAGDVLTIHQLTGWDDIGASIVIQGEIAHPGSYGFEEGEHLSDVLRRAGGFRSTAYPEGAVLTRPDVAVLEQKSRDELIRQMESSSAAAKLSSANSTSEQQAELQAVQQQQEQLLARLKSQPATGRLVIHIDSSIDHWAGTPVDIEVRSGDVLRIPKRPQFVLVSGQVYNPSAITFTPDKSAGWYLARAGGASAMANRKYIFVVRANGDVVGRHSNSWIEGDVLSTKLNPGDTIVVPQKIVTPSATWRNLLATAQIATSIAIAAAVAGL